MSKIISSKISVVRTIVVQSDETGPWAMVDGKKYDLKMTISKSGLSILERTILNFSEDFGGDDVGF